MKLALILTLIFTLTAPPQLEANYSPVPVAQGELLSNLLGGEPEEMPQMCTAQDIGFDSIRAFSNFSTQCQFSHYNLVAGNQDDGARISAMQENCDCLTNETIYGALFNDRHRQNSPEDLKYLKPALEERYLASIGKSIVSNINASIENLALISQLSDSAQGELPTIASCSAENIANSMKSAVESCPNQELAHQKFKSMFKKAFGYDESTRANMSFDELHNALLANIRANATIWGKDTPLKASTPDHSFNSCVSLREFHLYNTLNLDLGTGLINAPTYQVAKADILNGQQLGFPLRYSSISHTENPLISIILENPDLSEQLSRYQSNTDDFVFGQNYYGNDIKRLEFPTGNTLAKAIAENPNLKYRLVSALARKTANICKDLVEAENYKSLFCPEKIIPDPELALEFNSPYFLADNLIPEAQEYLKNEKPDGIQTVFQACYLKNNGMAPEKNPLLESLKINKRPISVLETFKSGDLAFQAVTAATGTSAESNLAKMEAINQLALKEASGDSPPLITPLTAQYAQLSKAICPRAEADQNTLATDFDRFKHRMPEELAYLVEKYPFPDLSKALEPAELTHYATTLSSAIVEHYAKEKGVTVEDYVENHMGELEARFISPDDIFKDLNVQRFEAGLAITKQRGDAVPVDEAPVVLDYFAFATADDEARLTSIADAASNDFTSNVLGAEDPLAAAETYRWPTMYTPKGFPEEIPADTYFQVADEREPIVVERMEAIEPIIANVDIGDIPTVPKLEPVDEKDLIKGGDDGLTLTPNGEDNLLEPNADLLPGVKEKLLNPPSDAIVSAPRPGDGQGQAEPTSVSRNRDHDDTPIDLQRYERGLTLSSGNRSASPYGGARNSYRRGTNGRFPASTNQSGAEVIGSGGTNNPYKKTGDPATDALIDQLQDYKDKYGTENQAIIDQINRMKEARARASSSRGVTSSFHGQNGKDIRSPSRNPYGQFQAENLSARTEASDSSAVSNADGERSDTQAEGEVPEKFTDKASHFAAAAAGTAGSSGASSSGANNNFGSYAGSSAGSVSGGPSGAGVLAGPGGKMFIPADKNAKDYIDPLNGVIEDFLKKDQPHILAKVIPHALIINNENGAIGLVKTLGLEGRRFTTLDMYYVGDSDVPHYMVRIYDYNVGNKVINDVAFRKRLVKTISILKKNDAETHRYMKTYYTDSDYRHPDEVLGGITAKLKLMYERPACSNPDYDHSGPCVSKEEINELKANLLTEPEMLRLINHEANLEIGVE